MSPANLTKTQRLVGIYAVLAIVTLVVYAPVVHHQFVNYDDPEYITENVQVGAGITWPGIVWAFENKHAGNWHPLTWISHMVDCQLFGLDPAGHHAMNVLFHVGNTLLLFLLLNQITGAMWRSALVAALFAWHPLHVESVAWAAERKDVLSTLFWLLTLMAYARFVKKPGIAFYLLALFGFACGLMSKPMVVTLPFVLLLLDYWPFNRLTRTSAVKLCVEKIPFFALSIAGSVITFVVQKTSGAFWSAENLPPLDRVTNALVAYLRYISKTLCPTNLAIIYPHPHHWPVLLVAGAALMLLVWSALFLWRAKPQPYLIVGWFWFLGTLVPTIGLVQVGVQSIADRYMYIPSIGLFICLVWGINDLLSLQRQKEMLAALMGAAALAACIVVTSLQLKYWQTSRALFTHAVEATADNYAAEVCLGEVLEQAGLNPTALALYSDAVKIEPDYPLGQFKLGMILLAYGKPDDAFIHLSAAAQLMPHNPDLQYDLGVFLRQHGKPQDAVSHFKSALKDKPDFPEALNELAWLFSTSPDPKLRSGPEAVQLARRACELTQYRQAVFLTTLSAACAEAGQFPDAIAAAQKARDLASAAGQKNIAARDDELLKLYHAGHPYRESD